jgi:hypothetical protein
MTDVPADDPVSVVTVTVDIEQKSSPSPDAGRELTATPPSTSTEYGPTLIVPLNGNPFRKTCETVTVAGKELQSASTVAANV